MPPSDRVPLLGADNLSGGYGTRTVLHAVSLDLRAGEFVALLGRNGCGKSTLLKILSGVLPAASGTLTLCGAPLAGRPRRAVARLMAVAPQDLHVPFAYSVREVVEMGRTPYARFLHGPHPDDLEAVERALQAVELTDLARRPYADLSGGEQQRVAVALALAQEARIVLLDEPTVHLDIAHQMTLLALLRRLCRGHGLAVLAAMHDVNLSCLYADRLLVVGEGTLLASGSPHEVITAPLIERAFGTRVAVGRHPQVDVPQVSLLL